MIELQTNVPASMVAAVAHGKVTGQDYDEVLVPAIEAGLRVAPKLALYYEFANDFEGFTAAAAWDDAVVGLRHFRDIDKAAVVADVGWVRQAVRMFAWMMPCPVKVFALAEAAAAKQWLAAPPAQASQAG